MIYIWWPWKYGAGRGPDKFYTPLLGVTLGLALLGIAFGVLTWGKEMLPKEVSIQDRHDQPGSSEDRAITGQTMLYMADELGVKRRPLLGASLAAGLVPVAAVVAAPLVGGLISDPHKNKQMFTTGWQPRDGKPVRMVREDGRPIRPADVSVGGQLTVFPGIEGGVSNRHADSPTLLIHLRESDATTARANNQRAGRSDYMWANYIAYSKICTHAGCPASLYEQQTNILLCPCHQPPLFRGDQPSDESRLGKTTSMSGMCLMVQARLASAAMWAASTRPDARLRWRRCWRGCELGGHVRRSVGLRGQRLEPARSRCGSWRTRCLRATRSSLAPSSRLSAAYAASEQPRSLLTCRRLW